MVDPFLPLPVQYQGFKAWAHLLLAGRCSVPPAVYPRDSPGSRHPQCSGVGFVGFLVT